MADLRDGELPDQRSVERSKNKPSRQTGKIAGGEDLEIILKRQEAVGPVASDS